MKYLLIVSVLVLLFGGGLQVFSQQDMREYNKAMEYIENGGEVYFTFVVKERAQINQLTNVLSIDKVDYEIVHAYANKQEFEKFLQFGFFYEVLTHPGDLLENPAMSSNPDEISQDWDVYPTFDAYVDMMYQFEQDYPALCKITQIGESVDGRELLYAKISDNVDEKEAEPRHMYTSTMHGDETCMYVNLLRLIDYLLSNYSSDSYVKYLVDNVEIWVCPDENPDGTYQNDNSTVQGARRYNANGTDLNRHYPQAGENLDRLPLKDPECQAVMDFVDTCEFVLSANCHGGAELLNYPYDYRSPKHEDDEWMKYVYRKFADTVHSYDPNHLTGMNDGITNGYEWYMITGSRMDYFTYFKHMREVTFEASSQKLLSASSLPVYWDFYYKACLQYIEQNLFGINGTVTCAVSDTGLKADVYIDGHDEDNSYMISKLPHGDFWRPIYSGTYDVEFSCDGYQSHTEENVQVQNDEATVLNIKLWPIGTGINNSQGIHKVTIMITPYNTRFVKISFNGYIGNITAAIFDISGRLIKLLPSKKSFGKSNVIWNGADETGNQVANGCYLLKLNTDGQTLTKNFVLSR